MGYNFLVQLRQVGLLISVTDVVCFRERPYVKNRYRRPRHPSPLELIERLKVLQRNALLALQIPVELTYVNQ